MKTKINTLFLSTICLATLSFIFSSCSDDDEGDTTAPVINLTAPAEGATLHIGSDIHFDMEVSDNESLKSYKVNIHENMSNPHSHAKADEEATTKYFSYQNTWDDISGLKNSKVHHHEIIIPEDATPGNYHFIVYCIDAAGNESYIARNVVLSHDDGDDDDDHDHDHE